MLENLAAFGLTLLSLSLTVAFVVAVVGGAIWLATQLDRQLAPQ